MLRLYIIDIFLEQPDNLSVAPYSICQTGLRQFYDAPVEYVFPVNV